MGFHDYPVHREYDDNPDILSFFLLITFRDYQMYTKLTKVHR